jgi:hypothetical protein
MGDLKPGGSRLLPRVGIVLMQVHVCELMLLVIFSSAVLGLELFSGVFYSCNDKTVAGVKDCIGSFTDAEGAQIARVWSRPFYNFDSIGSR